MSTVNHTIGKKRWEHACGDLLQISTFIMLRHVLENILGINCISHDIQIFHHLPAYFLVIEIH